MMSRDDYAIRGGSGGRERLRVLSRVLRPQTLALFEHLSVSTGMRCLDMGCGGGDVTFDLCATVGPTGHVVGVDMDDEKLRIARDEAEAQGLSNIEFTNANVVGSKHDLGRFDFVYARQLLCHVPDPAYVVGEMMRHAAPSGIVAVEDIDFTGYFSYPSCPALARYMELVRKTMQVRGGDADIGPRLPGLLVEAGLTEVGVRIAQPVAMEGEAKVIQPITMDAYGDSAVNDGFATASEVRSLVEALDAFAADPNTVMSVPRYVQTWGRRPPT